MTAASPNAAIFTSAAPVGSGTAAAAEVEASAAIITAAALVGTSAEFSLVAEAARSAASCAAWAASEALSAWFWASMLQRLAP